MSVEREEKDKGDGKVNTFNYSFPSEQSIFSSYNT